MVSVEEIPKENVQSFFPPMAIQAAERRPRAKVIGAEAVQYPTRYQLNLSGVQVLAGFTSAFGAVGLLLWAFIRLWLFER